MAGALGDADWGRVGPVTDQMAVITARPVRRSMDSYVAIIQGSMGGPASAVLASASRISRVHTCEVF